MEGSGDEPEPNADDVKTIGKCSFKIAHHKGQFEKSPSAIDGYVEASKIDRIRMKMIGVTSK